MRVVVGVLAALVAALLAVTAGPVGAATFGPAADTYVDASAPTANYGTKAYLRTDDSPLQRSYLRFDVTGVSGPTSAVLRFYAETASRFATSGAPVRVHISVSAFTVSRTCSRFPARAAPRC